MRTIVKKKSGFTYLKFQPGDGTIYTALFGRVKDNYYIALGSGDYTHSGYFFSRSSVKKALDDLINIGAREDDNPLEFIKDYHYTHYVSSKVGVFHNVGDWTVIVTILFAAIVMFANPYNGEAYDLIRAVYLNDTDSVLQWAEDWLAY